MECMSAPREIRVAIFSSRDDRRNRFLGCAKYNDETAVMGNMDTVHSNEYDDMEFAIKRVNRLSFPDRGG